MQEDQRFETLYESIFTVGINFMQQGKFDDALTIFDGLMALEPSEQRAAIAYGEALLMANRAEKALNHFFALSKQFDVDGRTLVLTAKACILLERPDEARKLLTIVIDNEVDCEQADVRMARVMMSLLEPV